MSHGSFSDIYNLETGYPQVRAGTLEENFRPPKRVWNDFPRGGLGINEWFLDLWQLVLGRFWNQIFGSQAFDPRTPWFWSLSVVKKRIKNCIQAKSTISQAQLSACFFCSHANPLSLFLTPKFLKIDPNCHFREISGWSVWSSIDRL
jgi:hypothetical protein